MAAYPDTPLDRKESNRKPVPSRIVDRNDTGRPWIRDMGNGVDYFEFLLFHPFITAAQKNAVIAHYNANRDLAFDLLYKKDGVTYSVVYKARPAEDEISPGRFNVTSEMVSVA